MNINRLDTSHGDFADRLEKLLAWESVSDDAVLETVNEILRSVKTRGDDALLEFSRRFDGLEAASAAQLEMPLTRLEQAYREIDAADRDPCNRQRREFAVSPSARRWNPGNSPRRMAPCWVSR